jgi:hypothetical protein
MQISTLDPTAPTSDHKLAYVEVPHDEIVPSLIKTRQGFVFRQARGRPRFSESSRSSMSTGVLLSQRIFFLLAFCLHGSMNDAYMLQRNREIHIPKSCDSCDSNHLTASSFKELPFLPPVTRTSLRLRGGSNNTGLAQEPTSQSLLSRMFMVGTWSLRYLLWYWNSIITYQEQKLNFAAQILGQKGHEIHHSGLKEPGAGATGNTMKIQPHINHQQDLNLSRKSAQDYTTSMFTVAPRKTTAASAISLKALNASIPQVGQLILLPRTCRD